MKKQRAAKTISPSPRLSMSSTSPAWALCSYFSSSSKDKDMLSTSLSFNLSHGGNKWVLTEAGDYQCLVTSLTPLRSLKYGISSSKTLSKKLHRTWRYSPGSFTYWSGWNNRSHGLCKIPEMGTDDNSSFPKRHELILELDVLERICHCGYF